MEAIPIRADLAIPSAALAASYTRDLAGAGGGPDAARVTPATVELRLRMSDWPELPKDERERVLAFPPLKADRRGTVRVVYGETKSRRSNLAAARDLLRALILEAIETDWDAPPAPLQRRHKGVGLRKGRSNR